MYDDGGARKGSARTDVETEMTTMNVNNTQNTNLSAGTQARTGAARLRVAIHSCFSQLQSAALPLLPFLVVLCLVWSFVFAPIAVALAGPGPARPTTGTAEALSVRQLLDRANRSARARAAQQAGFAAQAARYAHPHFTSFRYQQAAAEAARRPRRAGAPVDPSISLLDEIGLLSHPVPPAQVKAWAKELQAGHSGAARAALLHVWVGEYELAKDQQPGLARTHFRQARLLLAGHKSVSVPGQLSAQDASPARLWAPGHTAAPALTEGLAFYDDALGLYYQGAYREATSAFLRLLQPRTARSGYSRNRCTLWFRHAEACSGYHDQRSRMGIPEPTRLDPMCGPAALATCFRALGLPWDRKSVLSVCRATGEGSTMQDMMNAGKRRGASVRPLTADDQGLRALPKPLIAFVEHDHYIVVTGATARGVSYLCSDCGPWPGGRVSLTWKQWHALNGGFYAAVTKAGGVWDRALDRLPANAGSGTAPHALQAQAIAPEVQVASAGRLSGLLSGTTSAQVRPLLTAMSVLNKHVVLQNSPVYNQQGCINRPTGMQCESEKCCPTDNGASGPGGPGGPGGHGNHGGPPNSIMAAGPSSPDPVNLATGEEEYEPKADLSVYNPHGPGVIWGRLYDSLRNAGQGYFAGDVTYEANDFGQGWSQTYNEGVYDPSPGTVGAVSNKYIFLPNGARIQFNIPAGASAPTAASPGVPCIVLKGFACLVTWNYDATSSYGHYTMTWSDRTQWVTTPINSATGCYALAQLIDRNGNALTFNYAAPVSSGGWPLLASITNQDGTALLTIQRVGDGNVACVSDCYGRSVYYHVETFPETDARQQTHPTEELDHVSQIVPTCAAASLPDHYVYGYSQVGPFYTPSDGYGPTLYFLHAIQVPSPAGSGMSTATINYSNTTGMVTSLVDANGNTRSYASVDASGNPSYPSNYTQVTVSGTGVKYSRIAGWDNNMSDTSNTDGSSRAVQSSVYSDPNDAYRPSSSTDGNGNVTRYVWDQYGHMHQETSPRGTVTNYTWAFPSNNVPSVVNSVQATNAGFALGEQVKVQQGTKTATVCAYYEPSGLVKSINSPLPGTVGVTLPTTPTYAYQYDAFGDITSVTSRGNNVAATITTTYDFGSTPRVGQHLTVTDNLGHATRCAYDAQANKLADMDALGNETDRQYTIANDLYNVIYPATGQTGTGHARDFSVFLYPGGPILTDSKYDESGTQVRQVQLTYGKEGELLSQVGNGQPEYITYDALYRPATFSDGKSQATTYAYNAAGYAASMTYPNGNIVQFTQYDTNGNLLTQINGRGVETDFVYADPESKLTDIQYPATPAINVHFTHDGYGRKSAVTDGVGSYAYTFDDLNEQASATTTYTGLPAQTISYGYYPDGSHQSMTTPAGTFSYTDDAVGRAAGLSNPSGETSTWTFLNNNWIASQNSGGILTASYTHNQRGMVTDLTNRRNSDSALLSEFGGILYDSVGNMDSVTATVPSVTAYSGTTTYAYNSKNELNTEQGTGMGGYTNSFSYDAAGNPTTFKGTTNSFNNANQNTANAYDGAGNPTTYQSVTLSFDAEDRLTACGSTLTNGYRGDSLRAWKQNASAKTYFLYAGTIPVCELSSSGAVTATNTFGPNGLISRHTSSGSIFYAFDAHGSVCERVTGGGTVTSAQVFDAYGSRQSTDGNTDPYCGFGGQSGYYTDWETGTANAALELLTFRYYNPTVGRFLTRDPSGYKGGANSYEYVGNGPTGGSDPLGLLVLNPIDGIVSGAMGCLIAVAKYNGSDQTGSDASYNACLAAGQCAASIAGGAAETAVSAWCLANPEFEALAPCLAGAAEGLASSLINAGVNAGCQGLKPCPEEREKPNWPCIIFDATVEAMSGCVAGGILGDEVAAKAPVKAIVTDLLTKLGDEGLATLCEGATQQGSGEHKAL